jgi:hypothetical protein
LVRSACMQCTVWYQHRPGKLEEPLKTRLIQDLGVSLSLVIEAPGHSMVRTMRQVQSMVVPQLQEAASSFPAKHY